MAFSKGFFKQFLTVALAASLLISCSKGADDKKAALDPAKLRGGETRATLSPSEFTGPEARAYQIAKEIPEIIDSLYCYCDCEQHFGHKSLLTCYVDEHAKHCDICMDEAFMAYELHKQGKDVSAIRAAVDERFSKMRH